MKILRKYRGFVVLAGMLLSFLILLVIVEMEEESYALKDMGFRSYIDKIEITNWNYDDSTIYLDLYNSSNYWFKTIDIKFTHGQPLAAAIIQGGSDGCIKGQYYSGNEKEYQFRIELDDANLLKPKTTGQYRINAGAVLTQVQKCRELKIINAKGYEARK